MHMMVKVDLSIPMVAGRACPTITYEVEEPDGSLSFLVTTVGAEHLVEKYKDMIGKCVVPSCHMDYFTCKAWEEDGKVIGTKLEQVVMVDPKGNFPDFVKTIIARFLAEPIMMVADFIMNPPPGIHIK